MERFIRASQQRFPHRIAFFKCLLRSCFSALVVCCKKHFFSSNLRNAKSSGKKKNNAHIYFTLSLNDFNATASMASGNSKFLFKRLNKQLFSSEAIHFLNLTLPTQVTQSKLRTCLSWRRIKNLELKLMKGSEDSK